MCNDRKINWIVVILSVFNVILGTGIGYIISAQPDFTISVRPINTNGFIPSEAKATVTVENLHDIWFKNYKHQIFLNSEVVSGPETAPDIKIDFDQIGVDPTNSGLPFRPEMKIIIGSNATKGQYKIKITGFGGDGKERSCMLILKIHDKRAVEEIYNAVFGKE